MTTIYLITGFLGAGKTSFLHEFVRQAGGKSLRVIVNEFGKVGVDGRLLASLGASLDEIAGGSIFCSCRSDQFEKALETALEVGPDCIVVEASGLSDPTGVRKLLAGDRYKSRLHYGGCICLADAVTLHKVYATARVCKKQLSICDAVLLNKADIASPEQREAARALVHAQRPDVPITQTTFGRIPEGWLDAFHPFENSAEGGVHMADLNLHSLSITLSPEMSAYELTKFLEAFAEDTYRVKGFVNLRGSNLQGSVYHVDCVGNLVQVKPYEKPVSADNVLTVLYGYGLPARKSAQAAAQWYPGKILSLE